MKPHPPTYPRLFDEPWLREHYEARGLSADQVAELIGCSGSSVINGLNRFGITIRGRHYGHWKPKSCRGCGDEFVPSGPGAIFCSRRCRNGTGICAQCSMEFVRRSTTKSARTLEMYCSRKCKYTAARHNGGRYLGKTGYVTLAAYNREPTRTVTTSVHGYALINLGDARARADGRKDGRILEHRYVMEQVIGRQLDHHETVHHINGNKQDNRIENLQLRSGRHGKGVVHRCLDCGSQNIGDVPL